MENKITEQDSLRIINEMVAEARNNFNSESSKIMEFMGYCVSVTSLLNIILWYTLENPSYSFFVWFLMIPASLIDAYMAKKRKMKVKVVTHVENIVDMIWRVFGAMNIIFLATIFTWAVKGDLWILTIMIMPCILLFTAFATYITGVACRYAPFKRGGVIFGLGAVACIGIALTPYYAALQFVVLIICMIFGFIIPARQANKHE